MNVNGNAALGGRQSQLLKNGHPKITDKSAQVSLVQIVEKTNPLKPILHHKPGPSCRYLGVGVYTRKHEAKFPSRFFHQNHCLNLAQVSSVITKMTNVSNSLSVAQGSINVEEIKISKRTESFKRNLIILRRPQKGYIPTQDDSQSEPLLQIIIAVKFIQNLIFILPCKIYSK